MHTISPLRYPGGKSRVANFIKLLCLRNGLAQGHYAEPYAGGASVALSLLTSEIVRVVHINDLDPGIFAFWTTVLEETDRFCDWVSSVPLTVSEWERQRRLYFETEDRFLRGAATFYLNRTNRSGIIANGGIIGGKSQEGRWGIDARFGREGLVKRIRRIARYRSRIRLSNLDAIEFLAKRRGWLHGKTLVYLDPPYYVKGQNLYRNAYSPGDHAAVAEQVERLPGPWVVSYDNVPEIRALYGAHAARYYDLGYSARVRKLGREAMFFSPELDLPEVTSPAEVSAAVYRRKFQALMRRGRRPTPPPA